MRASYQAYEEVARHCSQFNSATKSDSYTNSYSDKQDISCANCKNFDEEKYCKLDLYDQITKNHKIEG